MDKTEGSDRAQWLPPWLENPFALISWLDMNKFSAGLFVNIGSSLQWFSRLVETGEWNDSTRESAQRFSDHLAKDLREIGCRIAAQAAVRFGNDLPDQFGIRPVTDLKPRARALHDTIYDEMKGHLFFWVPFERARYYELPENKSKWDESERAIEGRISDRFSKAANEIKSARTAYAVAQWTPCVFHLMRACESGIKALYKTLDLATPKLSDSWGNMLGPMDDQVKKKPEERHGAWAVKPDFFDHATNDVRAIKRTWRDPTMHIESDYDESGALKALNAVTSFFEHVSSHLDQDGKFYP